MPPEFLPVRDYRPPMSLVWEEPPARPRAEVTLQDQLRERPGVWAKVLTADKVQVSRLGGDLHRQGFEINVLDEPDGDGTHSLYAQYNPGERTINVVRPGTNASEPAGSLLDEALAQLLTRFVQAVGPAEPAADLQDVLVRTRWEIKTLFTGPDAVRRYLRSSVGQPG